MEKTKRIDIVLLALASILIIIMIIYNYISAKRTLAETLLDAEIEFHQELGQALSLAKDTIGLYPLDTDIRAKFRYFVVRSKAATSSSGINEIYTEELINDKQYGIVLPFYYVNSGYRIDGAIILDELPHYTNFKFAFFDERGDIYKLNELEYIYFPQRVQEKHRIKFLVGVKKLFYREIFLNKIYINLLIGLSAIAILWWAYFKFIAGIVTPLLMLSNYATGLGRFPNFRTHNTHINAIKDYMLTLKNKTEQLNIANLEIRKSKELLQKVKQEKSMFTANIAHEITIPANKVINHAEYLASNIARADPNNPMIKGWEEVIHTARFIQVLVLDLIDYATSDGSQIIIKSEPINLRELCDYCVSMNDIFADQRGIEISFKCTDNIPLVMVDELRFKQIVNAFLGSAIANSPEGEEVKFDLSYTQYITMKFESKKRQKDAQGKSITNPFYKEDFSSSNNNFELSIRTACELLKLHGSELKSKSDEKTEINIIVINNKRIIK